MTFGKDTVGNCNGCGETCSILEYIEVIEEMGDSCPFKRYVFIYYHSVTEILLIQLIVRITHYICGEGLALLGIFVHPKLELGKHSLTINGAAELLEEMVDKVCSFLLVGSVGKKMLNEQYLVAGGSDFSNENHIIPVCSRLILDGIIGMQGMTHLMSDGEHAVKRILLIEKHIGMRISACGICTAALAFVFVNIDPAVVKALL